MADEMNPEQNAEPTEAERAKFEQDVLNAAQEAMNSDASSPAEQNDESSATPNEGDAGNSAEQSAEENQASPADGAAKESDAQNAEIESLKIALAEANNRDRKSVV